MKEYHKIEGLYEREPETKRLLPGVYRNPVVAYTAGLEWEFTEKIDGTNIRVIWDGYRVSFAGRTDNAIIPKHLLEHLEKTFGGEANEQVFEQHFGEKQVILYGEGYGPKIQNGGNYRPDVSFILFDVAIDDTWLARSSVEEIAGYFGIDVVPIVLRGTIKDAEEFVRSRPKSNFGTADMEGVVGRPKYDLMARDGKRVIVKVKVRDYDEIDRYGAKMVD